MRILTAALCFGAAFALVAPTTQGIGIPAKLKAKKVQGNLVPAYYPSAKGRGHGDDEGDDPAILDTPMERGACSFLQGKYKIQVGKDVSVQLKGVECGGMPYTGSLCAHTKSLSTIMNEEIAKDGTVTPGVVCNGPAGDTANTIQFVTGNVGLIDCDSGKCKGVLPPVSTDPCPEVDKVNEIRRIEVFDGPDITVQNVLGAILSTCCGPTQTLAGGIAVSAFAPCNGSLQDVMGESGTVLQGVQ